jgi:hypothetical protein
MSEEIELQSEAVTEAPEQTPVEGAPETPTPEPVETVEDRSWAAIKAHERRLVEERAKFKEEKRAADQAQQQYQQAQDRLKQLEGGFKEDPLSFLEENGVKFEDLANRVLNDGKATPEELIKKQEESRKSEIAAMREEITKLRQAQDNRENERLISEYQRELSSTLKGDEFGLLRAYGDAEGMVFNAASSYASEHGEVLTPEDAARRVQGELEDQLKRLSTNKAIRDLLGLSKKESDEAKAPDEQPESKLTTLTNALAATPASDVTDRSGMSRHQRLMHAARLIPD